MTIAETGHKINHMMHMKVTVAQVLTGAVATITTTVMLVTYVHVTFQTRTEADREHDRMYDRIEKIENAFTQQSAIQNQIAVDVSNIRGRLEGVRSGR